ncbi:unnamed protein product [Mytilus coruscus]|uniref:Uncharacterized protein n=1 Tax=Mytilus coruscus TaxID=42192 RepID=A0A6J8BRB3_MYTCO|nr:unnamed protein product [Mytilus coruscus]
MFLAVHVKYFRQPETWFEAQKICQDEGGRLATDKESTLTCDKIEGDVNSAKGSTFWTGKHTRSYWISREGCYNIARTTEASVPSLSECFAVCREQNISLDRFAYRRRDHKCVCLHNNALMTLHESHNCSDFLKLTRTYFLYIGNSTSGLYWDNSQKKCRNIVPENLNATCEMHYDAIYRRGIWLPIQKLAVRTEITDRKTWRTNSTEYLEQTATSHTGIIIGGVIGTTVLIVVIVLIIGYKFRCKNATSKKANDSLFALSNGQSPTYEDHHKKKSFSNDKMFNNKLYDEQCLPPCKIVPDESIKNEINNREDCRRQNDDYSVPMKIKKAEQSTQEEDIKDGNDVESEYDILNKTRRSLNNTLEHNIYDTTIESRCESDPTYNTATNMSNRENIDDMYDRL